MTMTYDVQFIAIWFQEKESKRQEIEEYDKKDNENDGK